MAREERRNEGRSAAFDRKNPPFAKGAKDGAPSSTSSVDDRAEKQNQETKLFIAEGVDGVELGGTRSRIEAGGETDKNGDGERGEGEPPRDGGEFDGIEILAVEIVVGPESHDAAENPAESDADDAAEETHDASFDEEELLDVGIGGTEGFEDADFTAAFEDGHDKGVDDAERGNGEGEAAEDADEEIEDGEKDSQRFGSIEE